MEEEFDVNWDTEAVKTLNEIHDWSVQHISDNFAKKLVNEILTSTKRLHSQPESYSIEPSLAFLPFTIRYIRVRDFKVLYTFTGYECLVLHVHHIKQNPQKLISKFKKE
jgi:plasmid stabilization system protein ParE